jgi:RimJ/RimL family protein N-acetyltransferase
MSFTSSTFLRRAERDDLDTILSWMEDPDFQFFLYGDEAQSTRQVREKIIQMLGRSPSNVLPPAIYLLIDSKAEGLLGMISLQNISWRNRSCSLDVYIGAKSRRNSLLTAISVFRVLEYVFDELNLHRVSALIYAFNNASWRIFELAGSKRELVLDKHVMRNGILYDAFGYGLLRQDFEAVRAQRGDAFSQASLEKMVDALAGNLEDAP